MALLFLGPCAGRQAANLLAKDNGRAILEKYCLDCHQGDQAEAGQDFSDLGGRLSPITELIFENVATGKMPPADADHPDKGEKRLLLEWLASRSPQVRFPSFRRLSRSEFVQSSNDLLGIRLDLTERIPDDRGSFRFDSNRRIALSQEVLSSYFSVADQMLEFALPRKGFPVEQEWVTNKLKDSHSSYNIYVKDFRDGLLFSWTRANNGNSYSFFYDHFEPPVSGWYELTFDAAKVGDFPETVSLQGHGGKYYFADDRPQPQRLLGVISLDNREVQSHKIMVFLEKGENVSVHLHSKHTFRKKNSNAGGF
ncbi:MAG: DUF1587 domain-containing protein, partial [SAR324 cluster bacterium]|nr:DUF1587 domain-containing protein [SAR324 cluster bacterium]